MWCAHTSYVQKISDNARNKNSSKDRKWPGDRVLRKPNKKQGDPRQGIIFLIELGCSWHCYYTINNTRSNLFKTQDDLFQVNFNLYSTHAKARSPSMQLYNGLFKEISICNRWIQLTSLHLCTTSNSGHVMDHLGDYNWSVHTYPPDNARQIAQL